MFRLFTGSVTQVQTGEGQGEAEGASAADGEFVKKVEEHLCG